MEIRVVVFDDNAKRRESLAMLIDMTDGMSCVGSFTDCTHVVADINKCNPNVVLMDIDMPYINGIEGVSLIRKHYPSLKILMQTVFEDDDKLFETIKAGADGYILKKAQPQALLDAIEDVLNGGAPMTPSIARKVLHFVGNTNNKKTHEDFKLTERETEILSLLVQGLSYKMIAERCFISLNTVNSHIQKIYEKLQVNSAVEAVTKAIGNKIV